MALDTRNDRLLWGVGNLAIGALCIPFCYGLSGKDFTSFKFLSAASGVVAGLNSVRLFHEHEQGAGLRSAWRASAEMVSGAWIEEIASANLPPSFQAPIYQPEFTGVENLQPVSQFHLAAPPPQSEDLPDRGDGRQYGKMPGLSWYPSVLIYGISGAGKTTFTEEEISKRLAAGHEIVVLDPHVGYEQWQGCEVVGDGMDYKAIDAKITWFKNEVERRYKIRRSQKNPKFKPLTIVTEEFTNWADRCKYSGEHFKTVNSDIRKIECYSIVVTHTRTLSGLGDAKGMASLRDESMLEVEILGDYNPETERATPRFEALVKMPGQALSDRVLVKIDRRSDKLPHQPPEPSDFPLRSFPEASHQEPGNLGSSGGMHLSGLEAILSQILQSGGNTTVYGSDWGLSDTEKFELAKLVIKCESGKEKRILYLWGAKSGGRTHQKYVEACGYLDRLLAQIRAGN